MDVSNIYSVLSRDKLGQPLNVEMIIFGKMKFVAHKWSNEKSLISGFPKDSICLLLVLLLSSILKAQCLRQFKLIKMCKEKREKRASLQKSTK